MSDRMPAEIWIGGKVSAALVAELCDAISCDGLSLQWGELDFQPDTAEDLLEARRDVNGVPLLWLCDDEAAYGEFDVLERFLCEHRIAFRRHGCAKYEYNAELVENRPDRELVSMLATQDGEPTVLASSLGEIKQQLSKALGCIEIADAAGAAGNLRQALAKLDEVLPKVPALEAFEIVDEPARKGTTH